MSDTQTKTDAGGLPSIKISTPKVSLDWATLMGLFFALGLIIGAISLGQSNANFINGPALMIVLFGTMAATAISYTGEELKKAGSIIGKSLFRKKYKPDNLAITLMDIAVLAKKKGVLSLVSYEEELRKDLFLLNAVQLVVDGYPPQEVERLLGQEIDAMVYRHQRSTSITRRAAEVAPAMGLIGTLVGLVQMLADLENPETIGPAMAVALLTTFYGAILGTVVMSPLAVKLEKNSSDETLIKSLIAVTAASIARQDNPRRLEMLLNSVLPPAYQIQYFDV